MIIGGDKKKTAGLVVDFMKGPAPKEEPEMSEGDASSEAKKAIAEDLISAVEAKDAAGVVAAMEAMFAEMEAAPHEEAEHEE
jgi:hypothetical protein